MNRLEIGLTRRQQLPLVGQRIRQLRKDRCLTQAELEQVKNTIWRRKFEGYCPGRTTNFGLENSGEAEALAQASPRRERPRAT